MLRGIDTRPGRRSGGFPGRARVRPVPGLPLLAEQLAGLRQAPADGRLAAAEDGGDLGGGEPLQVAQDDHGAVRQRQPLQQELDLLETALKA